MKQLQPIGTTELVSLPDDGLVDIPAKIDTGADSSAIWASNIRVEDGQLVFNLFAPGSVYYREEPVATTAFKTVTVKNSFGHEESRFKILLRIKIGKTTLRRWFSLADRSRNSYPILLGKNLLEKRFIVDVSRKHVISGETDKRVLALGAGKSGEFFDSVAALNKATVSYVCINYDHLLFHLNGQSSKVIVQDDDNRDAADYSLTYFKGRNRNIEFASAVAQYLEFKGRPYFDREMSNLLSQSKLTENMRLAVYNLPVPESICAARELLRDSYDDLAERLGIPFVLKEIKSDRGRNNYLLSNKDDFERILDEAPAEHIFMAQHFVPNDGFLRLYVTGKEVGLAIARTTHPHADPLKQHLNKPSGSANATLVDVEEIPLEVRELAIKAAICLDRQIAGVDLLQDKQTGDWYILEVNNAPQLRGGAFQEQKAAMMAKFFDKELRR